MVLFHIDKFCYSHMKTFYITVSMSKKGASSKHNSDALVFTNRNIGYFSINCFHEFKILSDFAIIYFRRNALLK